MVVSRRAIAIKQLLANVAKLHLCSRCLHAINVARSQPRILRLRLLVQLLLLLPEILVMARCLREESAAESI